MSPEERQLLSGLFDRVKTAASTPRDRDAEALIDEATRAQPYATYYLAQAVIVQEKGLEAASNHIKELEERVRQLEAGESERGQAQQGGGFLSSIFGSSQTQQPAPSSGPWGNAPRQNAQPPRAYDDGRGYQDNYRQPQPQQPTGPWSQQAFAPSAGSSFLHGALGTAAGVAGGMLLANSLSGIFGNHMSSLGLGSAAETNALAANAAAPVEETVINNFYGDDGAKQAADTNPADDGNDNIQQADYSNDDDDYTDDQSDGGDDSFV